MPIDIWPLLRPFIIAAVLLLAMHGPEKPGRDFIEKPEKEEIYDAEYDQLD